MKFTDVLLRASVWDVKDGKWTKERNIRKVHAIYIGDVTEQEDMKIIVLQGEMWNYKSMKWEPVYGEVAMVLNPGQALDKPIYLPFDQLGQVEWSTNRFEKVIVIGERKF